MRSTNNPVDTTIALVRNFSAPMAEVLAVLGYYNPQWVAVVALGVGLLQTFRDLAGERGTELLTFISNNKEKFASEIIETQIFKASLLNVWEMHIRENSESKRKRLRNFLLHLGSGENIPVDYHTKIYAVIEQMTDLEAEVFGIIFRSSNREQFARMNLSSSSIPALAGYNEQTLQDTYNSLHAYRLITIAPEAAIGGLMTLRQIPPFGEIFYDYVCCSLGEEVI